jgi:hypothetical protein
MNIFACAENIITGIKNFFNNLIDMNKKKFKYPSIKPNPIQEMVNENAKQQYKLSQNRGYVREPIFRNPYRIPFTLKSDKNPSPSVLSKLTTKPRILDQQSLLLKCIGFKDTYYSKINNKVYHVDETSYSDKLDIFDIEQGLWTTKETSKDGLWVKTSACFIPLLKVVISFFETSNKSRAPLLVGLIGEREMILGEVNEDSSLAKRLIEWSPQISESVTSEIFFPTTMKLYVDLVAPRGMILGEVIEDVSLAELLIKSTANAIETPVVISNTLPDIKLISWHTLGVIERPEISDIVYNPERSSYTNTNCHPWANTILWTEYVENGIRCFNELILSFEVDRLERLVWREYLMVKHRHNPLTSHIFVVIERGNGSIVSIYNYSKIVRSITFRKLITYPETSGVCRTNWGCFDKAKALILITYPYIERNVIPETFEEVMNIKRSDIINRNHLTIQEKTSIKKFIFMAEERSLFKNSKIYDIFDPSYIRDISSPLIFMMRNTNHNFPWDNIYPPLINEGSNDPTSLPAAGVATSDSQGVADRRFDPNMGYIEEDNDLSDFPATFPLEATAMSAYPLVPLVGGYQNGTNNYTSQPAATALAAPPSGIYDSFDPQWLNSYTKESTTQGSEAPASLDFTQSSALVPVQASNIIEDEQLLPRRSTLIQELGSRQLQQDSNLGGRVVWPPLGQIGDLESGNAIAW